MKKNRAFMALASLFFAAAPIAGAHAETPAGARDPLEAARVSLEKGAISCFAENDAAGARAAYDEAESETERAPGSAERTILLADINLARGELSEIAGDKKSAAAFFSKAYDYATEAYRAEPGESESCRAVADGGMRVLEYRSILFKISHGFEPKSRASKALDLDPSNRNALLSLGMYYLFCPKEFGGSAKTAKVYFERYAAGAKTDFARFKGSMWIAIASRQAKDFKSARDAFAQASSIFPGSEWLASEKKKLDDEEAIKK